jgi:hypothetical protein
MGGLGQHCGDLIDCASYEIGPERPAQGSPASPGGGPDCPVSLEVAVTPRGGGAGPPAVFVFSMERQEWGLRRGAWQTKSLLRAEPRG